MDFKVAKFGGSSLADAGQFKRVANIVKRDASIHYVVASAPGKRFKDDVKITDMLYKCYEMVKDHQEIDEYFGVISGRYNDIIKELGINFDIQGELDYIKNAILHHSGRDFAASRGEYLNSLILAKYLGFDFIDAEEVICFRENGSFDDVKTDELLAQALKKHEYAVIPGFYGVMPNGTIKTFSRGGSDITGSIVAFSANATIYENWTDVSGCLMADPRIVANPLPIKTITYKELRELSYMGASVLHEEAIFPVRKAGIPINIRNTNQPDDCGTMIVPTTYSYDSQHVITGIAGKKGLSVINIEKELMNSEIGFGRKVLSVLEENNISFEHLPSGIDTMSLVISSSQLNDESARDKIINSIIRNVRPDNVSIEDNLALIAIVGRGMVKSKGVAARIFDAISASGVNIRMIDQGSSELNIIIGIDEDDYDKAINAIYKEFVKEN